MFISCNVITVKYSKSELIRLYKKETNLKVKERMLLVIKVEHDDVIPAYAADELHRSRPWALYWLKRYREEGIDGLKDRTKSGRPPDIPREVVYEIKNELSSRKEGWTTKQVEDLIVEKEWWNKISLYSHLQTHAQVGIQTEEGTKKSTCKYCIQGGKRTF